MESKNTTLKDLQVIASILAAIAIPIIIATFGYLVQKQVSDDTLKKDYIEIALKILSKSPKNENEVALRLWAVKILEINSEVPLNNSAIAGFETISLAPLQLPEGPELCMEAPEQIPMGESMRLMQKDMDEGKDLVDIIMNANDRSIKMEAAAGRNIVKLECLQKLWTSFREITRVK